VDGTQRPAPPTLFLPLLLLRRRVPCRLAPRGNRRASCMTLAGAAGAAVLPRREGALIAGLVERPPTVTPSAAAAAASLPGNPPREERSWRKRLGCTRHALARLRRSSRCSSVEGGSAAASSARAELFEPAAACLGAATRCRSPPFAAAPRPAGSLRQLRAARRPHQIPATEAMTAATAARVSTHSAGWPPPPPPVRGRTQRSAPNPPYRPRGYDGSRQAACPRPPRVPLRELSAPPCPLYAPPPRPPPPRPPPPHPPPPHPPPPRPPPPSPPAVLPHYRLRTRERPVRACLRARVAERARPSAKLQQQRRKGVLRRAQAARYAALQPGEC
jgi:hypothetical protein